MAGIRLLDELRNFMENRVVLTGAELGVFELVHKYPGIDGTALAQRLSLDKRASLRLLDSLCAIGYMRKEKDGYFLTENGSYLTTSHPQSILPMVLHYCHLWKNWSNLTSTVKLGYNPERSSLLQDPSKLKAFIGAMHVMSKNLAYEIAKVYDMTNSKVILDVGAGPGTYTIAFLETYSHLSAIVFDLDEVIAISKQYIGEKGLIERVKFVAGDFYKDPLPKGADLAFLSAIIHQNSPEQNIRLYSSVFEALVPRGKILIRDHLMEPDRTSPKAGALFAINMLVSTDGGDTYTFEEIKEQLSEAGFKDVKLIRRGPKMDCLVEAQKP